MEEPTVILRRFQDDCASATLSIAAQVQGMELNDANASYLDIRSASHACHHSLRKRRAPTPRWKRCHADCIAYNHRHLSSRRRRTRDFDADISITPFNVPLQDVWAVDQDYKDFLEFLDPIQLYYDFGYNAAALESIQPAQSMEDLRCGDSEMIVGEALVHDFAGFGEHTTTHHCTGTEVLRGDAGVLARRYGEGDKLDGEYEVVAGEAGEWAFLYTAGIQRPEEKEQGWDVVSRYLSTGSSSPRSWSILDSETSEAG